jgi:hydrogenase-4 component F
MTLILLPLIPFSAGLLCLIMRSRQSWEWVNLLAFIAIVPLVLKLGEDVLTQGAISLGGFLRADAFSVLVIGLTAFIALICAIYSVGHFRTDVRAKRITEEHLRRYYVLTPIFVAVMLLVPLADNLGIMWVAIEGSTLASVLLVTFYNQKTSFEAGWKYIIIGSIGIALALFGTLFAYYSSVNLAGGEEQHGMNWSVLVGIADKFNPRAMRLAFVLILLGYGTKAGLAPMHTWKPDAYSEAPVPTAALLGTSLVNCAIYAIARFDILTVKCLGPEFPGRLLAGFGVASILVAAPFVLTQRNFRRILAYSSIDHAGVMAAALGFGGKLGALGAALHVIFHGVTKPLLFFCAGNVQQRFDTPYFRRVHGVIRLLPLTGGLFLLATLAITGVPPFSIFQSEFITLSAALAAHHGGMAFLFIAGLVLIFVGFLTHMAKMNLGTPRNEQLANVTLQEPDKCPWKLGAMVSVAAAIIIIGFWLPPPIYHLVQQTVKILEGPK